MPRQSLSAKSARSLMTKGIQTTTTRTSSRSTAHRPLNSAWIRRDCCKSITPATGTVWTLISVNWECRWGGASFLIHSNRLIWLQSYNKDKTLTHYLLRVRCLYDSIAYLFPWSSSRLGFGDCASSAVQGVAHCRRSCTSLALGDLPIDCINGGRFILFWPCILDLYKKKSSS